MRQSVSAQRDASRMHQQCPGGKSRNVEFWLSASVIPLQCPGGPAGKTCGAAFNPAQIAVRLHLPHGGEIIIALQDYGAGQWNYLAACRTR
jgi:hypothetical protein